MNLKDRDCKKEQHIIKSDIDNEKYYTKQELNQALEMQAQKLHSNYEEVYERKLAQCSKKYDVIIKRYNIVLLILIIVVCLLMCVIYLNI